MFSQTFIVFSICDFTVVMSFNLHEANNLPEAGQFIFFTDFFTLTFNIYPNVQVQDVSQIVTQISKISSTQTCLSSSVESLSQ